MSKMKKVTVKSEFPLGQFFGRVYEGKGGQWKIGPSIYTNERKEYFIGSNPYDAVRVRPETVREIGSTIGKEVLVNE